MKIERDERKFDFHGIGLAIKKAREREGMTQEQLGYIVNRDPRTIMYHENDEQHPSLNAFYQMVTMFGISVDEYFYPDMGANEAAKKRINIQLNSLNESELRLVEGIINAIIFYFELTLYFDVFTKQILSWKLSDRRGGREQYLDGLSDVIELLNGSREPTIIHTDQGSVYSSKAYNELIKDSNIIRSMSRAGKPTDNPINEALNGWIKEELYMDFRLGECRTEDDVREVLHRYVNFYNKQCPCFALDYDTPDHYCERFNRGELEHRDTFSQRVLSEKPKCMQKKRSTEK